MIRRSFVMLAALLALAVPMTVSAKTKAPRAAGMPSCPASDPVVWVNTSTHVYHTQGDKYFGNTKAGQYACTSKATAMGAHLSGSGGGAKGTASTTAAAETPAPTKKKHHKSAAMTDATPAP